MIKDVSIWNDEKSNEYLTVDDVTIKLPINYDENQYVSFIKNILKLGKEGYTDVGVEHQHWSYNNIKNK